MLTGAPDVALQQRFVDGDNDAFSVLVQPHMDTMFTVALRLVANPVDAEDCLHEALILAMRKRRQFQVGRPIRPWLLRIVRNLALTRLRAPWWKRVIRMGEDPVPQPADPGVSADDLDRDVKIRAALMELPETYREVLALYHLEDMNYAEMQDITGVSVAALKQRVRRGSAALRKKLVAMYPEFVPSRTVDE